MRKTAGTLVLTLTTLLVTAASGCNDRTVATVEPTQTAQERTEFPVQMNRNLDLLFVIDNSLSMEAEQTSLAENFGRMVNVFESIEGGMPNIHVGVISTDMGAGQYGCGGDGDAGALQSAPREPGCSPPDGAFISNIEGVPNYSGSFANTFSCIARLGVNGCGFEQPLASMRKALDGSVPQNTGFLREDALLAIVFITDEDDCSARDPSMFDPTSGAGSTLGAYTSFRCFEFGVECEGASSPRELGSRENCRPLEDSPYMEDVNDYIAFVKGLKRFDGNILVAEVVGNPTPVNVVADGDGNPCLNYSCGTATVCGDAQGQPGAVPPIRLKTFMDAFAQSSMTTICNEDLTDALLQIANSIVDSLEGRCIEGVIADVDEETPGIQPDCVASEVRNPGTEQETEVTLPACDNPADPEGSTNLPCFAIAPDPERCESQPTHLAVDVYYEPNETVPLGTRVRAYCVAE